MKAYFQKTTSAAPLAVFRIALGMLLFAGIIRFWSKGWIHDLYIVPKHFFPFYGFTFVQPLGEYTYFLFSLCALSALCVALGLFYRVSSVLLFLTFTYIELIDKSTYLNHYYFISMVCLLMIFLPAHVYFSVDAIRNKKLAITNIPQWCIDSIKIFVCLVYVYAGLAKLNSDWLLHAQPLRIWLPAKNDLRLIGRFFNYAWVAYAFSWLGCVYDLSIPFLLMNRSTRAMAFAAVVVFHVLTAILFPIGMFPYIMMATALIFFSAAFHERIVRFLIRVLRISRDTVSLNTSFVYSEVHRRIILGFFCIFFVVQLILPWRYSLYPGELFWTEEGYRFSWRVMLMEKAGTAQFTVRDHNGRYVLVENKEFLTPLQEKMMATQPDMMLQYAHMLRDHFSRNGFDSPQVFVDSYVTVNGRLGKPLVPSQKNLALENESLRHKSWITSFGHEIKGL